MPADSLGAGSGPLPIRKQLERLSHQVSHLSACLEQLDRCESMLLLQCTSNGCPVQLDLLPVSRLRHLLPSWLNIAETCEFLGGDLESEATRLRLMLERVIRVLGPETHPSGPGQPLV
jgi:hypothetical protein